jgi:hypothetical protein
VVNLDSSLTFINVSEQQTEVPPTTPIAPWSTRVKHKRSNIFSPDIEATNKNNKVMVEAINCLNTPQLEIEDRRNKLYRETFTE